MVSEAFYVGAAGRMRYLEAGSGWPVVLLHAFPLSADMWRPQLEQAPDGWRLIAPDLRGFGRSAGPSSSAGPTTMDDLAADIVQLLDILELERATIGGLSMGGYVTFALFRRAPERFFRMILADSRAQADTPDGREARHKMLELVRRGGARAVADEMLPKLLGESTRRERPDVAQRVRNLIEVNETPGIAGAIEAMMTRPDSTPLLASIGVPALIVVGAEDTLTPPADSESMNRQIRRSQLVTLPQAGHLSSLEVPDAFSTALANFLASNL
jgi:pimeloyl-ACP methyl ester carboxylesterase